MPRLPLAIATFGLCACGPIAFDTSLSGTATVPGGDATAMLAALPLIALMSNLDFNTNADFESHDVLRGQLRLATVGSVSVQLTQPTGGTFEFLDSLQLVATSGDSETVFADVTAPATLMASPTDTINLPLTMTTDVTAQVAQAPMSFVMRGKGHQPAMDTQLVVALTLHVQAAPASN
jgi:hypothetical protein